jgi:hypothetical protein
MKRRYEHGGKNTDADQESRSKLYREYYAELLKRQLSNSENADRAILSVSTAALGFSLAFIKDIIALPEAYIVLMIYGSWGLFILAIIAILLSFLTAQRATNDQIELLPKCFIEQDDSALSEKTKLLRLTELLNMSGAILLVLGLVITTVFVGINLYKEKLMLNKNLMNECATVPKMQPFSTPPAEPTSATKKGGAVPPPRCVPAVPAEAPSPSPNEGSKGK